MCDMSDNSQASETQNYVTIELARKFGLSVVCLFRKPLELEGHVGGYYYLTGIVFFQWLDSPLGA